MADSQSDVFEMIYGNFIISHIRNCTNVEDCRMLLNNDWHVSMSFYCFIVYPR